MKNLNSLDIHDIGKALSKFLYRFHVVLFVVLVLGGMAIVIFMLNQTITRATDISQAPSTPLSSNFDEDTVNRLNQLDTSGERKAIKFPSGRINPFSE